jgi:hypothetical protein
MGLPIRFSRLRVAVGLWLAVPSKEPARLRGQNFHVKIGDPVTWQGLGRSGVIRCRAGRSRRNKLSQV